MYRLSPGIALLPALVLASGMAAAGSPDESAIAASPFLAARRAVVAAAGPDPAARGLALAAFYRDTALAAEGLAALAGVDPAPLGDDAADRHRMLGAQLHLLAGRAVAVPGVARWPEPALWSALARAAAGDASGSAELARAAEEARRLPEALRAAILPRLRQAAVEAGAAELAGDLAKAVRALPGQAGSGFDHWLSGRMAALAGDRAAALAAWRAGAGGLDLGAHRCRLDLARAGLAERRPDYAGIRALLEPHRDSWLGDGEELELLTLLARLYEETGALPEAVEVMGRIGARFPQSPAARLADRRARALLPRLYGAAETGEIPLGQMLALHERLVPVFGADPDFVAVRAGFADLLARQGASARAAAEYAALRAALSGAADDPALPRFRAELSLREARALIAGGQAAEATAVLTRAGALPDAAMEARRQDALAAAAVLDPEGRLPPPPPEAPSADWLRASAALGTRAGNPRAAADDLGRLLDTHPRAVAGTDAARLVVAARAAGAPDLAAWALGHIAGDPRALAETALAPDPDVSVLRLQDSRETLRGTEAVLALARGLLDAPETADNPTDPAPR